MEEQRFIETGSKIYVNKKAGTTGRRAGYCEVREREGQVQDEEAERKGGTWFRVYHDRSRIGVDSYDPDPPRDRVSLKSCGF